MDSPLFRCKKFHVNQSGAAHPIGTDSILIGAWADLTDVRKVLDIGTGTGIIALMMAQRLSDQADYSVDAVEIDANSAQCAQENFMASPWNKHLAINTLSIQEFAQSRPLSQYDLIISNPPFFNNSLLSPNLERQQARSTVTLNFEDLLKAVSTLLSPKGRFCVILPTTEGRQLYEMAACMGLYYTAITAVIGKEGKPTERLMIQLERNPYFQKKERLVIYGLDGKHTKDYLDLTKDFYL
jgi:tRNA1Val (adenine37-N6)-methyltransferase